MAELLERERTGCDPCGVQLSAAIAALGSFQQATEQADGKAGTLVTIQAGIAAVAATQIGAAVGLSLSGAARAGFWLLSAAGLVAFLRCGWLLAAVLTPRTVRATAANRFSLAGAAARHARGRAASRDREVTADDVWHVAEGVADIALRKSRRIAGAIRWTLVTLVLTATWLGVVITYAAHLPR